MRAVRYVESLSQSFAVSRRLALGARRRQPTEQALRSSPTQVCPWRTRLPDIRSSPVWHSEFRPQAIAPTANRSSSGGWTARAKPIQQPSKPSLLCRIRPDNPYGNIAAFRSLLQNRFPVASVVSRKRTYVDVESHSSRFNTGAAGFAKMQIGERKSPWS
jgi:hypothetical protein